MLHPIGHRVVILLGRRLHHHREILSAERLVSVAWHGNLVRRTFAFSSSSANIPNNRELKTRSRDNDVASTNRNDNRSDFGGYINRRNLRKVDAMTNSNINESNTLAAITATDDQDWLDDDDAKKNNNGTTSAAAVKSIILTPSQAIIMILVLNMIIGRNYRNGIQIKKNKCGFYQARWNRYYHPQW
jgi:hypothetical protein